MPVELHGIYYTVAEASERLGYASPSTLSAEVKSGKIPAVYVGRMWLIAEGVLQALDRREVKPQGNRGVARK